MLYLILIGILWNIGLLFQSLYSLRLFQRKKFLSNQIQDSKLYVLVAIRNEEIEQVGECIKYF